MSQEPVQFARVVRYAGFWQRLAALIIDSIILSFGMSLLAGAIGSMAEGLLGLVGIGVIWFVVNWLYFTRMESSAWQATVGKQALGLRVTDLNGERISMPRANVRFMVKLGWAMLPVATIVAWVVWAILRTVPDHASHQELEGAGWGVAIFGNVALMGSSIVVLIVFALTVSSSARKQALHDKVAGCVVVQA